MATVIHRYDPPERFVAGTVGQPGERTFFLQARSGSRVTSVALEKAQVTVLAERVDELLDEVVRRSAGTAPVPAVAPADTEDAEPLEQPIVEEFRVGTMALLWDGDDERLIIEAQAYVPEAGEAGEGGEDAATAPIPDDDAADGPDLLRVRLTGAQARAFARRALAVVAAGRKPCPFCALPLDPAGHVCPRQNGYRR